MSYADPKQELTKHLDTYLASLPLPERALTSANIENGQRSKQVLLDGKEATVPWLLDRLSNPDFAVKDACYDLVLEIGSPAKKVLYDELGKRSPILDIWIVSMLRYLGDESPTDRLREMLQNPDEHVRYLSALALAFQHLDSPTPPEEVLPVLVDALDSARNIEGTPFTVAGSALGCLTRMTGENFLSSSQEIIFYNYEDFLYPPPVHPFPFAADLITKASEEEQLRIRQRASAWLAHRDVFS
ncbi:MAG: HEAT repeat domain-containing protein [Cyanomargarita calcarea GSE-NOS-MK-12-04C]|jgi:hypothetical protein|uniref:HEAT repeat domain-containing protein n=1 Tax=Cyanomargarita calcarea GSE-NOS-MK-12-04C TaxID=2839659 RepID=A0A951QUP7_9CYAN|nr:HEAT repeat domain-containing protein [Cyanomargarita calcarea GSE-NOS-MK-12-04C]